MKKFIGIAVLGFLLGVSGAGGRKAVAAEKASLKALNVTGSVMVHRAGKIVTIHEGDAIQVGDQMMTNGDSFLDVVKAGAWGYRLLQSGDCKITRSNDDTSQIELNQGNIIFNVNPNMGQRFSVKTPVVVAAVRGTQFWGQVTPSGEKHNAIFAVREGKVEVTVIQSKEKFLLEAGQAIEIKGEAGTAGRRAAKATELEALRQATTIPFK